MQRVFQHTCDPGSPHALKHALPVPVNGYRRRHTLLGGWRAPRAIEVLRDLEMIADVLALHRTCIIYLVFAFFHVVPPPYLCFRRVAKGLRNRVLVTDILSL